MPMKIFTGIFIFILLIATAFSQTSLSPEKNNFIFKAGKSDKRYINFYGSIGALLPTGSFKNYFNPGAGISVSVAYKTRFAPNTYAGILAGLDFSYNSIKSKSAPFLTQADSLSTLNNHIMMLVLNAGGILSGHISKRIHIEIDAKVGFNLSIGNNALLYLSDDAKGSKTGFSMLASAGAMIHYMLRPNETSLFLRTDYKWISQSSADFLGIYFGVSQFMY